MSVKNVKKPNSRRNLDNSSERLADQAVFMRHKWHLSLSAGCNIKQGGV